MSKVETVAGVSVAALVGLTMLPSAAIKADQDNIKSNLTKLDMAIHANAVQCLMHAEKHGDTSLMRRLLVDVIDAKTGYRRQGLINWMRKWSPMELKGDLINLSGTGIDGEKRPFLVKEANDAPFWTDQANREIVRPVFQANLMTKINSSVRDFRNALANTIDGKPIDVTKPFYDGIYTNEMAAFFDNLEIQVNELSVKAPDNTQAVRKAQLELAEAMGTTAKVVAA